MTIDVTFDVIVFKVTSPKVTDGSFGTLPPRDWTRSIKTLEEADPSYVHPTFITDSSLFAFMAVMAEPVESDATADPSEKGLLSTC